MAAASAALAHPPKSVSCSWNGQTSTLTVTASHEVNDAAKHYVLTLTVLENGKQIVFKQYSKQDSAAQFSDSVLSAVSAALMRSLERGSTVLRSSV